MAQFPMWLAKQFDGGVTVVGAVIACVLVASGIGALLALVSDQYLLAILLGSVFGALIVALFVAARTTDPNLKLSQAERFDLWKRTPAFARKGLLVFFLGNALGPLVSMVTAYRYGNMLSWLFTCAALIILAKGMQKEKPPLPRHNAEPLHFSASPAEYERLAKSTALVLYVGAVFALAFAALGILR